MAFCKEYNAQTAKMAGDVVPVEITVYEDRSFTFILKTPPTAVLLKKAAGEDTGHRERRGRGGQALRLWHVCFKSGVWCFEGQHQSNRVHSPRPVGSC